MRDLPLIYLTRHGQTDWNAESRFQGQRDIPLNDTGRAQARGNGATLGSLLGKGDGFDFVASPLSRARETMEIARDAMGLDPAGYRTDGLLKELCYGDWEGRTFDELRSPSGQDPREPDKWHFRPPGPLAESYADLTERVRRWLDGVHEPTVAVAHGGVVRSLFHILGGRTGDEAAHEPTPQDRVLRIEGGEIGWVEPS